MSVWPFGHWCWSPYIIYMFFSSSNLICSSVAFADVAVAPAVAIGCHCSGFALQNISTGHRIIFRFCIIFFCQCAGLCVLLISFLFVSLCFFVWMDVNEKIALLLRIKHNKVVDGVICNER